jgi:riboflavin kinase/FMN adenylyltransferase
MGRDRQGDAAALEQIGLELGYRLQVVPAVEIEGEVVSSSRIRAAIGEGQAELAARLLGRPYRLEGAVVRGEGRGKSIGIPTANLSVPEDRAMPGNGVYICRAQVSGKTLGAATNVGVRPTFDGHGARVTVEAHLLDFDEDLYGQIVSLDFLRRVRGERQFPNPQALVAQIQADIAEARRVLTRDAAS